MKVRLIKYKNIEPVMYSIDNVLEYKEPTITCGFPSKSFLMISGECPIDKFLKVEAIPADLEIMRMPVPKGCKPGALYLTKNVAKIDLHLPPNTFNPTILEKALFTNTIKALGVQKLGIVTKGNDLLFEGKKFLCFFRSKLINDWDFYVIDVSFEIDYGLMNKVFKLDTEKMAKKGKIKDMREVVIGVDEFKQGIDREKFLDDFISNLAQRFDWQIEEGVFTKEELQRIDEISPILSSKEWNHDAKQYKSKIKQWWK